MNVLGMKDFQDNILFVNSKKAFSLKYIQYHEELLFRGHLSSAAVSCAYHVVHGDSQESILQNFDKLHASALFYYMAVRELPLRFLLPLIYLSSTQASAGEDLSP